MDVELRNKGVLDSSVAIRRDVMESIEHSRILQEYYLNKLIFSKSAV